MDQNIGSPNSTESLVFVYPNPANEYVSVQWLGSNQGQLNCHLLKVQGRILHSTVLPEGTDKILIPLSQNLSSGMYMIRLSNDTISEIEKLFLIR